MDRSHGALAVLRLLAYVEQALQGRNVAVLFDLGERLQHRRQARRLQVALERRADLGPDVVGAAARHEIGEGRSPHRVRNVQHRRTREQLEGVVRPVGGAIAHGELGENRRRRLGALDRLLEELEGLVGFPVAGQAARESQRGEVGVRQQLGRLAVEPLRLFGLLAVEHLPSEREQLLTGLFALACRSPGLDQPDPVPRILRVGLHEPLEDRAGPAGLPRLHAAIRRVQEVIATLAAQVLFEVQLAEPDGRLEVIGIQAKDLLVDRDRLRREAAVGEAAGDLRVGVDRLGPPALSRQQVAEAVERERILRRRIRDLLQLSQGRLHFALLEQALDRLKSAAASICRHPSFALEA